MKSAPRRRLPFFTHRVVLISVYLFLATAAAVKIGVHETQSSELIARIAKREDLNGVVAIDEYEGSKRLGFVLSSLLKFINPSGNTAAQVAEGQREVLAMTQDLQSEFIGSLEASLVLVALSVLFLIAVLEPGDQTGAGYQKKIYALLAVSVIFFTIGISLPVLTAVVKGEHRIIGGFIIQTASKGIISTVVTLCRSRNWVIAVLLAGFSIGIPIFKGVSVLVVLSGKKRQTRVTTGKWLETIGRWSLTDVMVAAVLLSCFSLNALSEEDGGVFAVPRFAFGFFIAYCVLASYTSNLLKKSGTVTMEAPPSVPRALSNAILLILAAASGGLLGFYGLANRSYARDAAHAAVVKLVRSHTEVLDHTYEVEADKPAIIPVAVPFGGKLSLDVKGPAKATIDVYFGRDPAEPVKPDKPVDLTPLPGFPEEKTAAYLHTGPINPGHYRLILHDHTPKTLFSGAQKVAVHIGLDP